MRGMDSRRAGCSRRRYGLCLLAAVLMFAIPSDAQRPSDRDKAAAAVVVITRTINDCENNTDRFARNLRRAMNWSSLNGTAREDELNRLTRALERSMDRVGKSWNKDKNVSKTRSHVRDAITSARNIDLSMRARRLNPGVERDWREVRAQLNLLARAFSLPTISW